MRNLDRIFEMVVVLVRERNAGGQALRIQRKGESESE